MTTPFDYLEGERLYPFPQNASSVALASSITVKSGKGVLYGASILSTNAGSQFIQLHDALKIPANGAVPVAVYTVGASGNLGLYWGSVGRSFLRGMIVCNSSTSATLTIGAADTFFDVQYL